MESDNVKILGMKATKMKVLTIVIPTSTINSATIPIIVNESKIPSSTSASDVKKSISGY